MVLWVLTILMVIVFSFSFMTRTETLATVVFRDEMEKKFLAEAGIQRGITEIFYWSVNKNQTITLEGGEVWKTDGTLHSDQLGGGTYSVRITDESGKININTLTDASGIILKNLLITSGVREEDVDIIVDSLLDWKDPSGGAVHRLNGAGDSYYMSLPNPYKVKHAEFDTVEELLLVKGMTPDILYGTTEKKGIIGFLTVHSKTSNVNVNAAPGEVLRAVPGITPEIADTIIQFREIKRIANAQEVGIPQQSAQYINFFDSNTFTLDSSGQKESDKKGYAIRATIVLEGVNKYKFVYYKSPATEIYDSSHQH
jgi:general secretion pathway protein K